MDIAIEDIVKIHDAGQRLEADRLYRAYLDEHPGNCLALWNLGRLQHELGNLHEACNHYSDAALAGGENNDIRAAALNNIAVIMLAWGHYKEYAKALEFALVFNKNQPAALSNYSLSQQHIGNIEAARTAIEAAIELDPNGPKGRWNHAILQLMTGDFKRGWTNATWRFKNPDFPSRQLETMKPLWDGSDINNKRLILWHEQGIGDSLMMIRYADMVKQRWPEAKVLFLAPPELKALLAKTAGIDGWPDANTLKDADFDVHLPLMDLPRIFQTHDLADIPAPIPYIDTDRKVDLEPTNLKRAGLVWAGRPEHGRDRWRTIKCADYAPLFTVPGIQWYSLQYGPQAEQADAYPQIKQPPIKDWLDTAAILKQLDLLVTVDTSVLHLAGAMGRRTWALIPYSPDWRWLLAREDSPWYPGTLKLYRQPKFEDWQSVIERLRLDLQTDLLEA